MHLDRIELQLLLVAARGAAFTARAAEEAAPPASTGRDAGPKADAFERLAARLESELVIATAADPTSIRAS